MRIILLVHGYPPRECAGTEQHTATLARALQDRGHDVSVIAATRAPGRPQYATFQEEHAGIGVTRIVNNVPAWPLERAEQDPAMDGILTRLIQAGAPDLVHVQHIQFLSAGLRPDVPWLVTLHDAWAWCPSGGTLLELPEGRPCEGPHPGRCAKCYAAWRPVPTATGQGLMTAAGHLGRFIPPDRLHAAWSRLPARLRAPIARGRAPDEAPDGAARRAALVGDWFRAAHRRLAPSAYLATAAEAAGLGPVHVVPHGVSAAGPEASEEAQRPASAPFLFLGTVAHHKGPDLVVRAWRTAFPNGRPGLRLAGPVQDPALALGHPLEGPLDRSAVQAALRGARALVLGSRWPENAPLVVLEARAAGCPVIAPALGGLPELIEPGRDGWLVPPDDEHALASALREAVQSPIQAVHPPPTVDDMTTATEAHYRALLAAS